MSGTVILVKSPWLVIVPQSKLTIVIWLNGYVVKLPFNNLCLYLRLILSPAWLKRLLCALQWKFITRMWIKSICGVLSPKSDERH